MTKQKFGLGQINNPTPLWATWVFRIVFLLVSIAIFVFASDPAISDATKVRIGVYLKAFEMLVYGASKLIGVSIDPIKQQDPDSASQV